VFAKDWMGYGLSSRPAFEPSGVTQTEEHFVGYMERWRRANDLDRMTLCGHSLGGYLCVAYAERFPERVDRLILVSVRPFSQYMYQLTMLLGVDSDRCNTVHDGVCRGSVMIFRQAD
jgi:pimeloyl-ACP methyl ester carboxylesterase